VTGNKDRHTDPEPRRSEEDLLDDLRRLEVALGDDLEDLGAREPERSEVGHAA
jgi:hypothetical protein